MKTLALDSTVGGLGDIWMRLNALHSLAALIPARKIQLRIPKPLVEVSRLIWPEQLHITNDGLTDAIEMTHLGLRHLAPRLLGGQHFLSPFFQIQRADRKAKNFKHRLNEVLIQAVGMGGTLHLPTAESVNYYQGYHEFSAISEFAKIPYELFQKQAKDDFMQTRTRMQTLWPKADKPQWRVVVLPSGTGHQIMPPDWASTHLPTAAYAFHVKDSFKREFQNRGLQTVEFDSVEGLLKIASDARFTVVTDSFPSHPLQNYSASTIVALSQQPRSRIVHPAFDGRVVYSQAPCCPCANRARGVGGCDAGHDYCTTWSDKKYTQELLGSLA